ncbi:hypothetical protein [Bradyrhizobium sp. 153]|uniref:hypothetical protein n=1 Tax=Bradyrhizobium sp. 153 TaxID=2782627 RepID=UPI001FFA672E|nr:hypothetical protein [Bradyrhizobium sp. 153]MCK1665563.1 hypothetical protein [Bradyrhizobium sp. 153]
MSATQPYRRTAGDHRKAARPLRRYVTARVRAVCYALATIFRNGEINKIYAKWFLNPIPPNGISLNVPMSAALKRVIENPRDSGDPDAYAMR